MMNPPDVLALGVLFLILLPIVYFDLTQQRIPNICNAILGVAGFALQLWRAPTLATVGYSLLAAGVTAAALFGIIWIMRAMKRDAAFGFGDLKFLVASSLWVGFTGSTLVFVIASVASVIWAAGKSPWTGGIDLKKPLAFAPFLSGALVTVFLLTNLLA